MKLAAILTAVYILPFFLSKKLFADLIDVRRGYLKVFNQISAWVRLSDDKPLFIVLKALLFIGLPLTLGYIIDNNFNWFFSLLHYGLAVYLLYITIRFRKMHARLEEFMGYWRNKDWLNASGMIGYKWGHFAVNTQEKLFKSALITYLTSINRFFFAPVCFYMFFGLAGLLTYSLCQSLAGKYFKGRQLCKYNDRWASLVYDILHVFDVISARLMILSMAILSFKKELFSIAFRKLNQDATQVNTLLFLASKYALDWEKLSLDEDQLTSEGVYRMNQVMDLVSNLMLLWVVFILVTILI